MKKGFLSTYFDGIAIKRLSSVEANPEISNQHEINGVKELVKLFGEAKSEKKKITTNFLYISDNEGEYGSVTETITWYDSRYRNPKRSEHRLYYPTNDVTKNISEDDILVIAKQTNGEILFLVIRKNSQLESQILWLFNSEGVSNQFQIKNITQNDKKMDFATRFILEEIGIQIKDVNKDFLDIMIKQFDGKLPSTRIFSEFARSTISLPPMITPDETIIKRMEQEEILFRTFERHLITKKLKNDKNSIFDENGDIKNVDNFFQFSLSFQNSRKSRVGLALENHLEQIFLENKISYSRGRKTEGNSKPDFVFPHIDYYHDENCQDNLLTMLGSKSTCKDRWRQVLAEAKKITIKHLFTLEPSISENQTNEMIERSLQLVIPKGLFPTYKPSQQDKLINLSDFISLVKEKEKIIMS